jgi:uncharacterized membrane protein
LANQLIAIIERQTVHRHTLENEELAIEREAMEKGFAEAKRGQQYGLTVTIFAFILCGFAAYSNQPWVASVVGGATIASLAAAFITGRKK